MALLDQKILIYRTLLKRRLQSLFSNMLHFVFIMWSLHSLHVLTNSYVFKEEHVSGTEHLKQHNAEAKSAFTSDPPVTSSPL